jgi:hypothetical protein
LWMFCPPLLKLTALSFQREGLSEEEAGTPRYPNAP